MVQTTKMGRASFGRQFVALMKRNFIIKKRKKKHTLQEILYPVYMVGVLALVRVFSAPKENVAVPLFPENSISEQMYYPSTSQILLISPNTAIIQALIDDALGILSNNGTISVPSYKLYSTAAEAEDAFRQNSSGSSIGIEFSDGTLGNLTYTLRIVDGAVPSPSNLYGNQGTCREKDGLGFCQANRYLTTGFINLQKALDTALIRKKSGATTFANPDIRVQLIPKNAWTADANWFQVMASIYMVMAYSPFVNFMVVNLVTEKEKKIKEGMRIMGLRDAAFWITWALTYAIIILFTTLIIVLISWAAKLLQQSNMFVFFLLLIEYGLTIITMSFAITPFFDKGETAGGLASLATMIFSLLYLPVSLTRTYGPNGPVSSIPVGGQWALCLLSPVALAMAVDQAVYLDIYQGGVRFDNLDYGQFPLYASMTMLAVDFVLYGLLAVYFDNVIPGAYGQRKPFYFFLIPKYWCPPKPEQDDTPIMYENGHSSNNVRLPPPDQTSINCEMSSVLEEPVSEDMKGKIKIRIDGIRKEFNSKEEGEQKKIAAVDGISLNIYEGQITCLLGHNGAGKTTLINILTGMTPATSGQASIYGYDVCDTVGMNEIRGMTGVCPQHNILLDDLTCKEHLEFFGSLKGVPKETLKSEIHNTLKSIDLTDQADTFSRKLSGGQKRKLCVAIALIGDPKVIFLDEPTAGMDPYSRRHLWSLLKERRHGKVILLTTHFMDEADILADRKAFISKGKLKCVGSSLFLKNRFGVGYHLNMVVDNQSSNEITQLIQSHIPEAQLSRTHGKEMDYTLPITSVNKFSDLFKDFDSKSGSESKAQRLGIRSYGVSMTSLEEVFLKIGIDEDTDEIENQNDENHALLRPQTASYQAVAISFKSESKNRVSPEVDNSGFACSQTNIENGRNSMGGSVPQYDLVEGKELTSQRFWSLVKIRLLYCKRNPALIFFRFVTIVFVITGVAIQKFTSPSSRIGGDEEPLELYAGVYSDITTQTDNNNPNMTYTSSSIGMNNTDFLNEMYAQNIGLTGISNISELLSDPPHHMGVNIYDITAQGNVVSMANITAQYNSTALHSLACTVNAISNTLLRMASSAAGNLTTYMKPWPSLVVGPTGFNNAVFSSVILLGLAISIVPPGFGIAAVRDREIKARSQLRISGVTMNMYWAASFFVDYIQYSIISVVTIVTIYIFQIDSLMYGGAAMSLILLYFFYMPVNMLFAYNLSFLFDKKDTAGAVLFNIFFMGSFIPFMAVAMSDMLGARDVADVVHYICTAIDPPYAAFGGLYYIDRVYLIESILQGTSTPDIPFGKYFEWDSNILITIIAPAFHAIWLYFLLRFLEVKKYGGSAGDAFFCPSSKKNDAIPEKNFDYPADEDEDVKEERENIQQYKEAPQSLPHFNPVVIVENLRKEFIKNGGSCSKEKNKKVAVRNNTFAVQSGDVFGLLGPNGAGKTTTLNMIIAEEGPTKGQVIVAGHDIKSSLSDAFQAMGYCPQHDALWDEITLREHLECYSQLCGISKENTKPLVQFFLSSLQIQEHADKRAQKLSGGTKRKLSYAMSMLGKAQVVLLDEPSTGMDPKSKRFLWDTISAAFSGSSRGAILTTHYMEEADALCSRVAIMVNGQMECIGSTQHLKNRFGSGYILEIKLNSNSASHGTLDTDDDETMKALDRFVKGIFQHPELSEVFGDRAIYTIPQADVTSLADVFSSLEQGKEEFNVEEYSFSQSTLEQVFLAFAKHQLDDTAEEYQKDNENNLEKQKSLMKQQSVRSNHSDEYTPL